MFTGKYRTRTLVLFAVWFFGYSGIVYGGASFFPTYAVGAGWSAHELFLITRLVAVPIALVAFFLVAAFGERFERKTWLVISSVIYSACFLLLFAVPHSIPGQAVLISIATPFAGIWLFTTYNYTSAAYPTRVRSVGTGWTDGVGHLGTIVGTSLLVGRLFAWTAGHGYYGWILYVTLAGAIFPSLILAKWGMNQKSGVLEELST